MSAQQITEVNCGQGKKGHDKRNEAQSHADACLRGCVVSACRAKPPLTVDAQAIERRLHRAQEAVHS